MLSDLENEKKHFLLEFVNLNRTALQQFSQGHFQFIDPFYEGRENLLNILNYIEQKITSQKLLRSKTEKESLHSSGAVLSSSETGYLPIINEILALDEKIQQSIKQEKDHLFNEIQSIGKNKKNFVNYKTNYNSSKTNNSLDEEV